MMKALFVVGDLKTPGGVANYYRILNGKFKQDIDYFVAGTRVDEKNVFQTISRFFSDYVKFLSTIKKYDIVLINTSLVIKSFFRDAIFLLISKIFNKKVVVFFHGWRKSIQKKIESYALLFFKIFYFSANAFIVLSSEVKEKIREWGYTEDIYLLSAVIDNSLAPADVDQIRAQARQKLTLLFLTRIEREKGIYEALDTYFILKKRYPFLQMIVAGDGRELANAVNYVASKNIPDIEFVGYVRNQEKRATFLRSDIYLSPTYGEGMPIAMIEAMAFGLPVVTRPEGGIKDFFLDGVMGIITKSKDPQHLAKLTERLIKDKRRRLMVGRTNSRYVRDHFLASQVVNRLETVLSEVMHTGTAPY